MRIIVPITNAIRRILAVKIPAGLKTTGSVLCQHVHSVDLGSRNYQYVESLPKDSLAEVLEILRNEF